MPFAQRLLLQAGCRLYLFCSRCKKPFFFPKNSLQAMDYPSFVFVCPTLVIIIILGLFYLWNQCNDKVVSEELDTLKTQIADLQNRRAEDVLLVQTLERRIRELELINVLGPPPPYPGPPE